MILNIYVIRQVSQNIQYMKINDETWNGEDCLENYFKPQRYISRLKLIYKYLNINELQNQIFVTHFYLLNFFV